MNEPDPAPAQNDPTPATAPVWWLLGGAGLLGVCCLMACGLLSAAAVAWVAPLGMVRSWTIPFMPVTPEPGTIEPLPDGPALTPEAFAYPQPQDNSLGDPSAPLKIVEFGDFQCPYCLRFWEEAEKAFLRDYVATGKVYFTFRSLTIIGPESGRAAEAAYCAGEQGKFWPYHDVLFENQGAENSGAYSDDNLAAFARTAGLEQERFVACLSAGKYAARVRQDAEDARQAGVDASPSFLMNGALLEGAFPYDEFARIIENVLKGNFQDFPAPPDAPDGQNGF